MKTIKKTFIIETKYPECDQIRNTENYLQDLIKVDLVSDDVGK